MLRGHIRNAFETPELYTMLKTLHEISPLRIFIHTWGIQQNSLSWRYIPTNTSEITEEAIRAYFGDLASAIERIIIDPDGGLPLVGTVEGMLPGSHMPKRGWKNMWAGMYRIIEEIASVCAEDELVLNTRFDLCRNSNVFNTADLARFYTTINTTKPNRICFLRGVLFTGCDNFFIAPVGKMRKLIAKFHTDLDATLASHTFTGNQEKYVMMEAARQDQSSIPK